MPPPILDIHALHHAYPNRVALDNLSLTVNQGEIFALLGPNGSGKTTLFRILSTLIPPQQGTVRFTFSSDSSFILHPSSFSSLPSLRPHLAVVFQSPSLDKQLTAEENLRHHGHLYGLKGDDLDSRITQSLNRFNLIDRRRDLVHSLSGGMRRRVELAKGLLTRPRLLLMDEPSTGLDPSARIDLWTALEEARTKDNLTILLTTHLLDEADRSDRLAILDSGRIVALGPPTDLKSQIGADIILLTSPNPAALKQTLRTKLSIEPEQLDNTLRIERPRAHEFVPQIVEAAPGLINSISVAKPTLEDVFIHATGRPFRESPHP